MKRMGRSLLVCCGLAAAAPASAGVTPVDLQIAARALGFMQKPLTGEVRVGIVYVPGNAESSEEASALQTLMGEVFKAGNLVLRPVMIKLEQLEHADVGIFFLTSGVSGDGGPRVAAASRRARIPCVTVDIEQVRSGACVMGVRSHPKVEILVNRAAAASSGIEFSTVFRIMITEL
jgi:ABC-type uncharacterized transport system substrate-binding protein